MTLPTFSIVLETENLAAADIAGFSAAIASLLKQDFPISSAQKFMVIDTGDLSEVLKEEIKKEYPWLSFLEAPDNLSYYEVKQLGAQTAEGEVVVYCDADCIYTEGWLRSLLTSMQDPAIEIVAGETTIPVTGIYSLAMALNYILHRQEPKPYLTSTGFYYMNNFAIRRQLLVDFPIPTNLPIYRGNCSVHSRMLRKEGHKIWKQSAAKVQHAPPNGIKHYVWRFLVMGHDHHWLDIYFANLKQTPIQPIKGELGKMSPSLNPTQLAEKQSQYRSSLFVRASQKLQYLFRQIRIYLNEEPQAAKWLPFALPIVIFSQLLIMTGRLVTHWFPHAVLKAYLARFESAYGEKLFAELPVQDNQSPRLAQ